MKFLSLALLHVSLCAAIIAFSQESLSANDEVSPAIQLFTAMGMNKAHQRNVEKLFQLKLEAQPDLVPYKDEVRSIFLEKLSWKELEPVAEGIVSKNFNEREIEQMKKFYSTSAGRKSLELLPLILADVIDKGRQDVDKEIEVLLLEKAPKKSGKK